MRGETRILDVLRPRKPSLRDTLESFAVAHQDLILMVLRRLVPILRIGQMVLITRRDDIREVFLDDVSFPVSYADRLDVIMGDQPFILGMEDGPAYRRDTGALRLVMRPDDLQRLADAATARAHALVAAAAGTIEVVDYIRQVTFDVFCEYFGFTAPPGQDLRVIATRLFEFQFLDHFNDPTLLAEVQPMAKTLRDHFDHLIAARKSDPAKDDVLGRCLVFQAKDCEGFSDIQIRTALIGFLVGGLPQLPMAAPQALEQLLQRPDSLAESQVLAREDDDEALAGYVFEALRFDPLAPLLKRRAKRDRTIAAGTLRSSTVKEGATVLVALGSAMRDPRRVAYPDSFDPTRPWSVYMHFGLGLHSCFATSINRRLIPLMLKALLRCEGLRRAPGDRGKLLKRGLVAERLWVTFSSVP
jgi:cytochrome P450